MSPEAFQLSKFVSKHKVPLGIGAAGAAALGTGYLVHRQNVRDQMNQQLAMQRR